MTTTANLPFAARTSHGFLAASADDRHAAVTVDRKDATRFATKIEAEAFCNRVGCGRTGRAVRMTRIGS